MNYRPSVDLEVVLSVLLLSVAMYAWQPGGTRLLELVSDGLLCVTALLAAVFSLRASARFERGVPQRRAWFMIGLGMALWAIAEFVWTYYQIGQGREVPYPSLADFIWAIGYAPMVLGLWLGHRSLGARPTVRQKMRAGAAYVLLLAILAAILVRPMFFPVSAGDLPEALIGAYYLVGDLTLAFLATLTLIIVWDGLVGRPWLPIVIGLLLFSLSDTVFAYAVWKGTYGAGLNMLSGVIDIAYLAAYLSIALGAYRQMTLRLAQVEPPTIPHRSAPLE